jgi:hypothetical protein
MAVAQGTEFTGGCLCKAVRYRVNASPVAVRACWCRACQYLGAGSATVNALFPSAALTIDGALAEYSTVADSGNTMLRRFCPQCGTQVLVNSAARLQFTGVRVGTFDDPSSVRPAATIWTSVAPPWAAIDPNLPRVEQQPPPPPSAATKSPL